MMNRVNGDDLKVAYMWAARTFDDEVRDEVPNQGTHSTGPSVKDGVESSTSVIFDKPDFEEAASGLELISRWESLFRKMASKMTLVEERA